MYRSTYQSELPDQSALKIRVRIRIRLKVTLHYITHYTIYLVYASYENKMLSYRRETALQGAL